MSNGVKKMYVGGCVVLDRHAARISSSPTALAVSFLDEGRAIRRAEYARRYHANGAAWLARRRNQKNCLELGSSREVVAFSYTAPLMFNSFRRRVSGTHQASDPN